MKNAVRRVLYIEKRNFHGSRRLLHLGALIWSLKLEKPRAHSFGKSVGTVYILLRTHSQPFV